MFFSLSLPSLLFSQLQSSPQSSGIWEPQLDKARFVEQNWGCFKVKCGFCWASVFCDTTKASQPGNRRVTKAVASADVGESLNSLSAPHRLSEALDGVGLRGVDLSEANLNEAILHRATLVDTDLTDADLTGCRIYGITEH
jgi:uncharacterized protein YjbI with pentapeptide repeats